MHVKLVKNVFNHEISIFLNKHNILKLKIEITNSKLFSLSVINKVDVKITFKY